MAETAPAPDRPPPSERRPDAILFPTGWEPPGKWTGANRPHRLSAFFEPLLGAQRGQKAHWRDVGGSKWLVTLAHDGTLLHPEGHRLAKTPRYDWQPRGDGLEYGYLREEEA
jgi:hypothetical protein